MCTKYTEVFCRHRGTFNWPVIAPGRPPIIIIWFYMILLLLSFVFSCLSLSCLLNCIHCKCKNTINAHNIYCQVCVCTCPDTILICIVFNTIRESREYTTYCKQHHTKMNTTMDTFFTIVGTICQYLNNHILLNCRSYNGCSAQNSIF